VSETGDDSIFATMSVLNTKTGYVINKIGPLENTFLHTTPKVLRSIVHAHCTMLAGGSLLLLKLFMYCFSDLQLQNVRKKERIRHRFNLM